MITADDFQRLVAAMGQQAADDIAWSEALTMPPNSHEFAMETVFVICNSGMHHRVARQIFGWVRVALWDEKPVSECFRHVGKAAAIEKIWEDREALYAGYVASTDRLAYLESLPWIGKITKYHLAKNFGENVAKPDVHLQRLADREECTVQALCDRLAAEVGLRAATVDTVLWRACATGALDSRTGAIRDAA